MSKAGIFAAENAESTEKREKRNLFYHEVRKGVKKNPAK
jgi:hypothetical protein